MDFLYLIAVFVVFSAITGFVESGKKKRRELQQQSQQQLDLPMSEIEKWFHSPANQGNIPPAQRHPEPTAEQPAWTHEGESAIRSAAFAQKGLGDAMAAAAAAPEERNPIAPADADEWRKAIIFSEILKPKF